MDGMERLYGNGTESYIPQILVPFVDTVVMATGVVGHALVIVVLIGRQQRGGRLSHSTDTLLLALSVADLLLLACLPFHTAAIALGRWPFGNFLCKAVSFLGVACSSASVFTMAALAVARYVTVVYPAWTYRSRLQRGIRVAALALWAPASVLAAPQFAFRTSSQLHCFAFLPDVAQLLYGIALFLLAFALPLAVIVLMYAKIYRFLRRARHPGPAPQLERYQRQVTQTSALLVLVFTVCWLPSYILMFYMVGDTVSSSPGYRLFPILARLLASSSALVNPVLYVFMSHKFRKELCELGRRRSGSLPRCCHCWPWGGTNTVRPLNPAELAPTAQR